HATTAAIFTLSLHDALPILLTCCAQFEQSTRSPRSVALLLGRSNPQLGQRGLAAAAAARAPAFAALIAALSTTGSAPASTCSTRSEEHTSELQSQSNLVCRL